MKALITTVSIVFVLALGALGYWFFFHKDLSGRIVIPYIAHQKPRIDPHVPSSIPLADKLDEVLFDGLFNVSANASGVVYEDGLGELINLDANNVVTIRFKPDKAMHSSYAVTMDKNKIESITEKQIIKCTADDIRFSLQRIQKLGSLSPDYILLAQAIANFDFVGPSENNEITFQFRSDRQWAKDEVKEVLSFKIIPANSAMDAAEYTTGTGPYMLAGEYEDVMYFRKTLGGSAAIGDIILKPFIDNSTYATELKNKSINTLLNTPFGAVSPILNDSTKFFHKSSIATCFFALYFNCEKLSLEQRIALRKFVNNETIMNRFFRISTAQQRHISDYRSSGDNYNDYLNYSIFPSTSYYIEEQVVTPQKEREGDESVLPDTIRIQTCLDYDFREELAALLEIMNDPAMFHGKIKVTAVKNDELGRGDYDAVLVPVTGYRSNFLFDLYTILLREPDFASYRINLQTTTNDSGRLVIDPRSLSADKNFFRLDASSSGPEAADIKQLLEYTYAFMSTHEIGDKQAYARFIDELDQKLALGSWLFSLPSLAYLSTQFSAPSVDMYGTASQLSTVEKWQESKKK